MRYKAHTRAEQVQYLAERLGICSECCMKALEAVGIVVRPEFKEQFFATVPTSEELN